MPPSAQPVPPITDRSYHQGGEQMLDLAAAQSDRAWWRGCRLRSVAGATARKADASLANFAHRYHEVQRRTLCWSRPHSLVVAQGSVVLLSGKRRR